MKRKNTVDQDLSDDHQPQKYRSDELDIPDLNLNLTFSPTESPTCIIVNNNNNYYHTPPSQPNPTTAIPSLLQQPAPPPLPPSRARRASAKSQTSRVRRTVTARGRTTANGGTSSTSVRVPSMAYLEENGISNVQGSVKCKNCEKSFEVSYNVKEKFEEIKNTVQKYKCNWHHRAPTEWTVPKLLSCGFCGAENSCKPLITNDKKEFENINWLFLLVSQFLGCCTLEQLKYFCEHNQLHRTGAKDRLIFLVFFKLCSQLAPDCPMFNSNKGG